MIISRLPMELKWVLSLMWLLEVSKFSRLTFIYFKSFTTIRAKNAFFLNTSKLASPIVLTPPHHSERLHRGPNASQESTSTFQRRAFSASPSASQHRNRRRAITQKTVDVYKGKFLLHSRTSAMGSFKINHHSSRLGRKWDVQFPEAADPRIECASSPAVGKGFTQWSKNS